MFGECHGNRIFLGENVMLTLVFGECYEDLSS
jgi:hypothetical protein